MKKLKKSQKRITSILIISMLLLTGSSLICSSKEIQQEKTNEKPTDVGDPWGPIFSYDLETYPEYWVNGGNPEIVPVLKYHVFGFGEHHIQWEINYTILCTNGWHNYTYIGYDGLYIMLRPTAFLAALMQGIKPFKFIANEKVTFPLESVMLQGNWTASLYIDDLELPKMVIHSYYI